MSIFKYKSYCWSFGTTSFRRENFNKTIEEQLQLLNKFWKEPGMNEMPWSDFIVQENYYNFLKKNGFVVGEANRKDKDAREKTSGLVDIGLITEERIITNAGKSLLSVVNSNDFSNESILNIPKDCHIYLKQLMKFGVGIDGKYIRPFIVILYILCELKYISYDEFIYLIPLCVDKESTTDIIKNIKEYRNRKTSINNILWQKLLSMNNYNEMLNYFLDNKTTIELLCEIGINRKSRAYDKPYFHLYNLLYDKYINKIENLEYKIFESTLDIKIGIHWRKFLFDTINKKAIKNDGIHHFKSTEFDNVNDELNFKKIFFKYLHLFKAKSTLEDYFDLNRRYIRTTNCILFRDNRVELDTIPSIIFNNSKENLLNIIDLKSDDLFNDISLNEICPNLIIQNDEFLKIASQKLNKTFSNLNEIYNETDNSRYINFNKLIDEKFSNDKLITILYCFEERKDSEINKYITEEADIPTIFEYVLGIIWYIISGRTGKILDYMKLSLDADLLPRSHAVGGESDIVYEYEESLYFPKHTLLIEATLADKTNQRRMEMEPVSRHLGMHLLKSKNKNDYCIFATNYLDPNVISDFRSRKTSIFYNPSNKKEKINGMKIIPLETDLLKNILSKDISYNELYQHFKESFDVDLPPDEWYDETIYKKIKDI